MKTTRRPNLIVTALAFVLALPVFVATAQAQTAAQGQTVETGVVKLADSSLEYFSRGKGQAIVLLPGGSLTVNYLDGLAEALAKAGYRVVGINFRGSGKSTGPSEGVTLQTMADDVAGVIQNLKLGPVHVLGNDFGNRVARMLAASHPELTRSVILIASGGKIQPPPEADRALYVIFNPASTDAAVLAVMKYVVFKPEDAARVWAIIKPLRAPEAAGIEMAAAKATPLEAWWAPPGKAKYLILYGLEDQLSSLENGVLLQKDLGDRATLVIVPGVGHLLPLEQPAVTASQVIGFIQLLGKP